MITNSLRIIREIKPIQDTIINSYEGKENEPIIIGIRDRAKIDKVSCKAGALVATVWSLIDEKHPAYKEILRGWKLSSVFVQDKVGTMIYDSKDIKQSIDKIKLKSDGNERIKKFNNLCQADKERVVEITAQQIEHAERDDDKPQDKDDDGPDNWDDLLRNTKGK